MNKKNNGGIFSGPNALGSMGFGADAGTEACQLACGINILDTVAYPKCIKGCQDSGGTSAGPPGVTSTPPSECAAGGFKVPLTNMCTDGKSPTECAAGSYKDPFTGQCWPTGGTVVGDQLAKGCPAGTVGVPPFCLPSPGATTDPNKPASANPFSTLLGAFTNLLGGGISPGQPTTPATQGTPADGLQQLIAGVGEGFAKLFGQNPVGYAVPGTTTTATPAKTGVFGSNSTLILGVLGVGVAAVGYYAYKKSSEPSSDMTETGDGSWESQYAANRRRRRHRRSRARRNCNR